MIEILMRFIIPTIHTVCCCYVISVLVGILIQCRKNRNAELEFIENYAPQDSGARLAMIKYQIEKENRNDKM